MKKSNLHVNYNNFNLNKKKKLIKVKKTLIAVGLIPAILLNGLTTYTILDIRKSKNNSSQNVTTTAIKYIDFEQSDIKKVVDGEVDLTPIHGINKENINEVLNEKHGFDMEQYYDLQNTLILYDSSISQKKNSKILLDSNNNIDSDKLYEIVLINNDIVKKDSVNAINTFYSDAAKEEIKTICDLIADTCNNNKNLRDITEVASALSHLKIFRNETSVSCASVNKDLVLTFNPNMISIYNDINLYTGKKDEKLNENTTIFVHEIEHILQFASSDFNEVNGVEAGFCREYKKANVNSLWNNWLLEAAAELEMSKYLDTNTTLYSKKISYVVSYNLANIFDNSKTVDDLINSTFDNDLNSAFNTLNIKTEEEQLEFLKLLYSIQITQYDCDDFWEYYEQQTGKTLTNEERESIRMDIRTDAIYNLTKKFYTGMKNAILNNKITDLETVFYLMKVWELDSFNHLSYTENESLIHAKDFIVWHGKIQDSIFKGLSDGCNLNYEEIKQLYENYHPYINEKGIIINNYNLDKFDSRKKEYIENCFDNYSVTYYSSNGDMLNYIENNNDIYKER